MKVLFLLPLLCILPFLAKADETYKILPYSQKIDIDGKINEPVWKQLLYSEFFVPIKGDKKLQCSTRFKAFSDKEFLYILLELKGQKLSDLVPKDTVQVKDKPKLSRDSITFYFAPRPEIDDNYKITIDYAGNVEDCFIPEKAGQGYPYSPIIDTNWDSKIKFAVAKGQDETIYMEVQIPIEPLALQNNLFNRFGFNCQREAFFMDGKKSVHETSSWSHVNGELWDTQKYGLLQGPLYQEPQNFTESDLQNLDQMTNGMTALLKSLDIYYKAVIKYKFHIPEGTEVNGDFSNFDHIPLPQYTVKADGYFRFYNAYRYQPYKDLGNQIIDKLFKAFVATKSPNGLNYLLWNNLMSKDGIVYGYGAGRKLVDFENTEVPFDQSLNSFSLKDVTFPDGFGQGFLDLSEIKNTLDPETQRKIKVMLWGTLHFLHEPLALINTPVEYKWKINAEPDDLTPYIITKKMQYFWRVDLFTAFDPKSFAGELKPTDWPYLGQDIILMIMALYNFDPKIDPKFIDGLVKFSEFYMQGRLLISKDKGPHSPHNIYKLDHRMLSLAAFAKENNLAQFDKLDVWVKRELPKIYEDIPKVDYSENGATANSWSTQGVLEIYRLLGLKNKYLKFWKLSFDQAIKPLGIYQWHSILPMNFSSYPLYFDYAKKGLGEGILSESQCATVFKKMFLIYGNPQLLRDNLKYSLDLTPEQKNRPKWANTPFVGYTEGVLPEGIYGNGSPQAFYNIFGNYSINDFFKTRDEHARYEYDIVYTQYTAPFQFHSDRFSYGSAESYCLVKMQSDRIDASISETEEQTFVVEANTPNLPKGFPAFGHLDISNILYKNNSAKIPTGFEIVSVKNNDQELPFRVYQIFEFDRWCASKEDRAKLVFGLWNMGPNQKLTIAIKIRKKNEKQYFSKEGK